MTPVLPRYLPLVLLLAFSPAGAQTTTLKLWPGTPPGDEKVSLPPEADQTKPEDRLIAGRRIIKLGNVSTPLVEVYQPPRDKANGAAVIICPGGGHHILAWDLEGTEVAEWLNSFGVTGIVLKYRVPSRTRDGDRWQAAVQDAQRAIALTRAHASSWGIDARRLGVLGFSAGGETAGLAALMYGQRQYTRVDAADDGSLRPDFAVLIYTGGFYDGERDQLRSYIQVPEDAPPFFFVHAADDRVPVQNALLLGSALARKKVPIEVHVYPTGGHGYGLRRTEEAVTTWPERAQTWMQQSGFLAPRAASAR